MGDDRPGRARGYGTGVTKSSVTGFRAKLRRMRSESENYNANEIGMTELRLLISKQQQQLVEQEKSMTEYMTKTNEIISKLKDEVLLYRTAFGGCSDDFLTSLQVCFNYLLSNILYIPLSPYCFQQPSLIIGVLTEYFLYRRRGQYPSLIIRVKSERTM